MPVNRSHAVLAELLNAFSSTRLEIEHVAELGDRPVPVILAIRARKEHPRTRVMSLAMLCARHRPRRRLVIMLTEVAAS